MCKNPLKLTAAGHGGLYELWLWSFQSNYAKFENIEIIFLCNMEAIALFFRSFLMPKFDVSTLYLGRKYLSMKIKFSSSPKLIMYRIVASSNARY